MEEVLKLFIEWTKVKLHMKGSTFHCKEGQIWWVSIGMNIGGEQNGKNENFERPVLILKRITENIFWGVPLTSRPKSGTYYFPLTYNRKISWVLLVQIRVFSNKRLIRKIRDISTFEFKEIKEKLKSLI